MISDDLIDYRIIISASLIVRLRQVKSLITLSIDGWASPKAASWAALLAHYEDNGVMKKSILDFVRYVYLIFTFVHDTNTTYFDHSVIGSHSGAAYGELVVQVCQNFGIVEKVNPRFLSMS